MIPLLYVSYVLCSSSQSAITKHGGKMGAEPFSFNLFKAIGATVAFLLLLLLFDRQIHIQTLFYGAVYGIFVTVSMYTGLMGLATGPMALTSMIASFSLIIPTAYGIIVLDEKIGAFGMIGLSLLFISMVLFAARRKDKPLSLKWWIFSITTLIANGICSVVQKEHQISYPSLYRFQFMATAMITATVILGISVTYKKIKARTEIEEPTSSINTTDNKIGKGALILIALALLAGILNGTANYLTLHLCAIVNASVLYPVLSGATGCATWLVGRLIFKEKLSVPQTVGFVAGVLSLVLLNL